MSDQDSRRKYNILIQVKLDATRVTDKISKRLDEYISLFALKRTRDHFKQIFEHRYNSVGIADLKDCAEETIFAIDAFYNKVDDTWWYLQQTEDMPGCMEDRLKREIKDISRFYDTLLLYIDAELSEQEADDVPMFEEETSEEL